jgi:hypothetical protein
MRLIWSICYILPRRIIIKIISFSILKDSSIIFLTIWSFIFLPINRRRWNSLRSCKWNLWCNLINPWCFISWRKRWVGDSNINRSLRSLVHINCKLLVSLFSNASSRSMQFFINFTLMHRRESLLVIIRQLLIKFRGIPTDRRWTSNFILNFLHLISCRQSKQSIFRF